MKKNYYINPEIEVLAAMDLPEYPRRDVADYAEKRAAYMAARDRVHEQACRVVETGIHIMETIPYCHVEMTETLFHKVFGISISVMTGKLDGMRSINSAVTENILCLEKMQIPGMICRACYAETLLSGRKGLRDNTELNGRILSAAVIPTHLWPFLLGDSIFRIESFADVSSVTHARNYLNLIKHNPHVKFGIWTKNAVLWKIALLKEGHGILYIPRNASFGISSRHVNQPENIDAIKAKFPFVNFVFTVYDLAFAAENNVAITCGGRHCIDCQVCYDANENDGITIVNELLKSHQTIAKNAFRDRRKTFKINLKHNAGTGKPVTITYYNDAAAAVLAYIDTQVKKGVIAV